MNTCHDFHADEALRVPYSVASGELCYSISESVGRLYIHVLVDALVDFLARACVGAYLGECAVPSMVSVRVTVVGGIVCFRITEDIEVIIGPPMLSMMSYLGWVD